MSALDRINRARWSRQQRVAASDAFARQVSQEREEKLAALRTQLAAFEPFAGDPIADRVIATARAEITRLSS